MIVVADTSPLNYLILVGDVGILHGLYGRVLIPQAVLSELQHPEAPPPVSDWIKIPPAWLEVCQVSITPVLGGAEMDAGEMEAIALAEEYQPDALLLIDDEAGRLEARRRKIRTTGTLGILADAASRDLVDLELAIQRLRSTNFRAPESLLQWLIARNRQGKKRD